MDTEIEEASAARQFGVIEPRFVGSVRVVENELRRVNGSEFALRDQALDLLHA